MNNHSEAELLGRIVSAWGLNLDRVDRAGGTAGQTWRVRSGRNDFFVRRRGARTAGPQRIAFDHGLRRHLADWGFCATPPLTNSDGLTWLEIDSQVYEVYPWVTGSGISAETAELVRAPAARTLAHLHQIASSYTAPCELLVPRFGHFEAGLEPRCRFDDPAAVLEVIDHVAETYCTGASQGPLARAAERVRWLAEAYGPALYGDLPRHVIHGDYNCHNLLFDSRGRPVGVFDFDWAWRDVRIRDVADAVFFFGTGRDWAGAAADIWRLTACPRFDLETMREVVSAYEEISPLSAAEREALPLAVLARWACIRCEGVMKVPPSLRAEFLLMAFERPFEWFDSEGRHLCN